MLAHTTTPSCSPSPLRSSSRTTTSARLVSVLSVLLLSLSACSDQPGNANSDANPADQGGETTPEDMTGGGSSDASADLDTTPRDQGGEDAAPDAAPEIEDMTPDDLGDASEEMGEDLGMPEDMPADMTEEMGLDMGEDLDMLVYPDADVFPCAYPPDPGSNCMDGPHGPGAFLTQFQIVEDRTCCRDFDNDGDFENFIGDTLISTAKQSFGIDVNANIAAAINAGELAFLLEFAAWENDQFDASIEAHFLNGMDTMAPFNDNLAGFGAFYPDPASYDAMTMQPLWGFTSARVHNGELLATGGTLRIYFPGIVDAVQIVLEDVQLKANVTPGADLAAGGGVALTDGEISGAIDRAKFFDSLNKFGSMCSCIGQPIFEKKTNGSYSCLLTQDYCTNSPDSACRLTGQRSFCAGLALFSPSVDVDLDDDGKRDAFGFGARFNAVKTTIEANP